MNRSTTVLLASVALLAGTTAKGQVFYDGTLGTTLVNQGWLYSASTFPPGGTPSVVPGFSSGATTLDSTAEIFDRAGWATGHSLNPAFPILNRATGYTMSLDVSIGSEAHTGSDRAGFSWLAMGSDGFGVELGFWADSIWAQGTTPTVFTRTESATIDTSVRRNYTLSVSGSSYTLSTGAGTLLTGPLRNYFGAGGPLLPYGAFQNYVFLGDNTSEAKGTFAIHGFTAAAVPEIPSTAGIAAGLLLPAALFLRRRTDRR